MIHMLSRFDLTPEADIQAFRESYMRFFEQAKARGLVEKTGQIGERVSDTPMDTDCEEAPAYYVVMSFLDRDQLDRAYEYMATGARKTTDWEAHQVVNAAVRNPVFTCWQDRS